MSDYGEQYGYHTERDTRSPAGEYCKADSRARSSIRAGDDGIRMGSWFGRTEIVDSRYKPESHCGAGGIMISKNGSLTALFLLPLSTNVETLA